MPGTFIMMLFLFGGQHLVLLAKFLVKFKVNNKLQGCQLFFRPIKGQKNELNSKIAT